jgi:phosphatidylglycerol---prolipoprotein diacylglyceryl transferase
MHPELFKIGPVTFYSYGLLMGLAFVVAAFIAGKEADRKGFGGDDYYNFLLITLVVGVVFSRFMYVVLRLPEYLGDPISMLDIRSGGLAIHGGLLGGVLTGIWFSRRKHISFWSLADSVAPSLALGMGIARWGCLLAGCCYGKLSTVPWAVTTVLASGWRHPTQVYESILDFAIFGVLWLYRTRARGQGQVFAGWVGLYSIVRFIVEIYREPDLVIGPLTAAQIGSLALVAISAVVWVHLGRTQGNHPEASS